MAGYTLGGGISFLGRKYGLAANNVPAIELVTADGRLVRADREHEPDLFWALRGGGGSFGVVTALEFGLFPLTHAYAGVLWYPIERGAEVLHAWRELTRSGPPDELTTVGRFLNLPPIPQIPEPVRGKSFVIVEAYHVGDPAQADELLAPLRALGPVNDTIATVPMPALSHLHMDPEEPVPGPATGCMLGRLPAEADRRLRPRPPAPGAAFPLLSAELRHLGGELGRARPGQRRARLDRRAVRAVRGRHDPGPGAGGPGHGAGRGGQAGARARGPRGRCTSTSPRPSVPRHRSGPSTAYQRLRRIKAAIDPGDMIRSNHPVPPGR